MTRVGLPLLIGETIPAGRAPTAFLDGGMCAKITPMGTEVREGAVVLRKGRRLRAPEIAVLASAGCGRPLVSRKMKVGILSTGDELVPFEKKPSLVQIRDSNGPLLYAQALSAGANPVD